MGRGSCLRTGGGGAGTPRGRSMWPPVFPVCWDQACARTPGCCSWASDSLGAAPRKCSSLPSTLGACSLVGKWGRRCCIPTMWQRPRAPTGGQTQADHMVRSHALSGVCYLLTEKTDFTAESEQKLLRVFRTWGVQCRILVTKVMEGLGAEGR